MATEPVSTCIGCGSPIDSGIAGGQCPSCLFALAAGNDTGSAATVILDATDSIVEPALVDSDVLTRFDDYQLIGEIARGGMGIVYRARQVSLNRMVAIKMILQGQLATIESVRRFQLEAEATARLDHPGIVPIYDIGETGTQHYFSMKLIEGANLARKRAELALPQDQSSTSVPESQRTIARLISKISRALAYSHQHGVLHRDLKPTNILIDSGGNPLLTDFGLAKLTEHEASLTLSTAILGSPSYMAPEQARGGNDDVTTAVDVYGLGAILYELLTQRAPFAGSSALETLRLVTDSKPVPPRQINPLVHADLETITLKCLEKRPAQRYPSAAAVADELDRFLRREPITARPVGWFEHVRRWSVRNPAVSAMTAALLGAFLIGFVGVAWQWRRAESANKQLTQTVTQLRWDRVESMLASNQGPTALAHVASLIREGESGWKAAMYAISVLEQRVFPLPAAPPIRHPDGGELTAARLSPDGSRVVTASDDRTARLWDAETSEQIGGPLAHDDIVNGAEFSPDGTQLVTSSADGLIRLWDVESQEQIAINMTHRGKALRAQFDPSGQHILSTGGRSFCIWDTVTGRKLEGPVWQTGAVRAARFSSTGDLFVMCASRQGQAFVTVWDTATATEVATFQRRSIPDADISPDGSRVAIITSRRMAEVHDINSSEVVTTIQSSHGRITHVRFSPDGRRIALVGVDHWVRLWDAQTGLPVSPEMPHFYMVEGAIFHPAGDRLLSWSLDATARIWDVESGEPWSEPLQHADRVAYADFGRRDGREVVLTRTAHGGSRPISPGTAQLWQMHPRRAGALRSIGFDPGMLNAVVVSPDGKLIASANTRGELWLLESSTGEVHCGPIPVDGDVWGLLFTPDGERLIGTGVLGQINIWSVQDGRPLIEPVQVHSGIQPTTMSSDGRHFATGSPDGTVRIWDSSNAQVIFEYAHESEIDSLDFSPDGQLIASASTDGSALIYDLQVMLRHLKLTGHSNEVMKVLFSPDGTRITTTSHDFTARLWDSTTGADLCAPMRHQGEVIDAAFSPDGSILATAGRDRTVRLWNAVTGAILGRPLLHERSVRNVRFSPDGQRLVSVSFLGPRVWDVATGNPLTVRFDHPIQGGTAFQSDSLSATFTPDGQSMLLGTGSPQARLWDAPLPPTDVPDWFPDFLEAIAGQRVEPGSYRLDAVPAAKFLAIAEEIRTSPASGYYERWARGWINQAPQLQMSAD